MSSIEPPTLFPCPKCGQGRGEAEKICKNCGWHPDAVVAPVKPKSEPYSKTLKPKSKPYSKTTALFLGFLTMLPIAYSLFFMAFIFLSVVGAGNPQQDFRVIFILHFLVIILSWCLIGFYIFYLFKTDHVKQDQKALWAVVLFLGNMIAMPIFWYLYVWKPPNDAS